MKRCAIVTPGFAPVPAVNGGGVEQLVTTLIDGNEKNNNYLFDLYTIYDSKIDANCYKNTRLIQIKTNPFQKYRDKLLNKLLFLLHIKKVYSTYNKKVSSIISKYKYDYIIIENNMYLYRSVFRKDNSKSKYIFHLHNDIGNYYKPIFLCDFIKEHSYKILTVSNFLKNKLKSISESNNDNIFTLYNCVSLTNFEKAMIPKEKLNELYHIDKNSMIFLYCGRFDKEKGLLELIKAFKMVNSSKIALLIVGSYSNTKKNKYEREIFKEVKSDKRIKFAGSIDRKSISSYFQLSDVVIIPSTCEEAFGLVAIEAMAASRPLIISDGGALPEITRKDFAYIANRNDFIHNITKGIQFFLNNKDNLKIYGKKANDFLKDNKQFNEDGYYSSFVHFLEKNNNE